MSSGSYDAPVRELTAGQRRPAEDKKGSRHADVIDAWDPTGLGSASEQLYALCGEAFADAVLSSPPV